MSASIKRPTAPDLRPTGAASGAPSPAPAPSAEDAGQLAATMLLASDDKLRAAASELELIHLIANETRRLISARQVIVLRAKAPGRYDVAAVSSVSMTDRDTPFVRWIEGMAAGIVREQLDARGFEFSLPAYVDPGAEETRSYPFTHMIWQPIMSKGRPFAAMIIARERPFDERDLSLAGRQAAVYASAWQAFYGDKYVLPKVRRPGWMKPAIAVGSLVLAALPVPMSTLAPVEIIADHPQRITAPIDGIIKDILVEPNTPVVKGQPLLQFDETTLRSQFEIADRDMLVAQAQFERAEQSSFVDDKARHEVAMARTQFELKKSERAQAQSLLARTTVTADRDGLLIYADKDRWIGKPVKTGERIMQIADPKDVAALVEVPVADAIVLEPGARVRMFLDGNPLHAVPAHVTSEGYHAEPNSTQQLVYRVIAAPDEPGGDFRIGARGTAQIQGSRVPLIFYLLRRPISAARQHLGL